MYLGFQLLPEVHTLHAHPIKGPLFCFNNTYTLICVVIGPIPEAAARGYTIKKINSLYP